MKKSEYICIVAGKSGGHIIPGMTYAQKVVENNPDTKVIFFSTDGTLDRSLVALYPFIDQYVPLTLPNVPRSFFKMPIFLMQLAKAYFKSKSILKKKTPQIVVNMGGYISIPVSLAAWRLRIPVYTFELNAVPGKATKVLAKISSKIYICFQKAKEYFKNANTELVSYPVRFSDKDKVPKKIACAHLGLAPDNKILLILGGSQGSKFINELSMKFVELAVLNKVQNFQIIHQTGAKDIESLREFYKKYQIPVLVFDYRPDLNYCYSAADLVIARAGAGTLFELDFFNKSSIIIPLETNNTDHQLDNALAMKKMKPDLFTVIRQNDLENNIAYLVDLFLS